MNRAELILEISKTLRLPVKEVEAIARSAPFRYRTYKIKKRTGGDREINHPAASLKIVQRWLVKNLLGDLPVHAAAAAYVDGRGIIDNAKFHRNSNYFVRYDFKDFFPSISDKVVSRYFVRQIEIGRFQHSADVVPLVVRLVCHESERSLSRQLSIGAPSSPHISNLVMYEFDEAVTVAANALGIKYSRYADDIYLSSRSNDGLGKFDKLFRALIEREAPFVVVNEKKTQWMSRKSRVSVTGLKISSERKVSVGRELKRSVRTRVYLATSGALDAVEMSRLRGHISYLQGVEPTFVDALRKKYPEFFRP
ncbi:hypothetical protein J2X02_001667 [Pseudoxanthomonas japonensis]|uniref:retron St85 family RNA-directed DNA polymerase n=1 Tax=Pseudoxanthomonas japonensis TaxID=69284 RepID=UPI0028556676|nr:retron St85 family RNA-directed DNA polymerase [Pseudoxanthomonas japonensis]MDR7068816.1 hypothetical protein [Pseudoxanthomonas japonensis]